MSDYRAMYYYLFNGITDIMEHLQHLQYTVEELYLKEEHPPLSILPKPDEDV